MKVIQVSFDSSLITVLLDDEAKLIEYLIDEDDSFFTEDKKIYYRWDKDSVEKCKIHDITNKRGVIQYESH